MDRLTGRKPNLKQMAKRGALAACLLSAYVLANIFFLNSFDNWHFGNLYAASELTAVNYAAVLYGTEFFLLSLCFWNWKHIKPVLTELGLLCIFAAFGVCGVVFLFPGSVPQFHVPQAIFLTLITAYFMVVVSARLNLDRAEDMQLSRLSGGISPSASFRSWVFWAASIFGSISLLLLYVLISDAKEAAAGIAYGFAALMGPVCAWIVRMNMMSRALRNWRETDPEK